MREGDNPNKFSGTKLQKYNHQVIIPVYIPSNNGYFKDSFKIFKLCIQSLINTTHRSTYITIVNNGSCELVVSYLDNLLRDDKIKELIHSKNIGKINAVLKGIVGVNSEIVTVSDQDILFKENWQSETFSVFNSFPNAGVVGVIPMFETFKYCCQNLIFDYLFSSRLKFTKVENPNDMIMFYDSIFNRRIYNKNLLKKYLTFSSPKGKEVVVGSGHVVASYRKEIFNSLDALYTNDLLSGKSDKEFLDLPPLKLGYYRFTTMNNFAYHMGNVYENWMSEKLTKTKIELKENVLSNINFKVKNKNKYKLKYYFKNFIINQIILSYLFIEVFYKLKHHDD